MIKTIIAVGWTSIRFLVKKICYRKKFYYSGVQRFSPDTTLEISKSSKVIFGKKVRAHSGTRIRVRDGATLQIGNDVAFNYNCIMTVHDRVIIGSGTEIGPGVMIFDHDHDVKGYSLKQNHYITDEIVIGENVWIGANVTILRGSHIGDNSVVGAGAVLKGNYPENCLIVQKRETEERLFVVKEGEK